MSPSVRKFVRFYTFNWENDAYEKVEGENGSIVYNNNMTYANQKADAIEKGRERGYDAYLFYLGVDVTNHENPITFLHLL